MKKFFKRIKLFLKELINIITNFLVPVVAVLIAILEIFPFIPLKIILFLKTVEYWLFYAAGTAEDVKEAIEKQI